MEINYWCDYSFNVNLSHQNVNYMTVGTLDWVQWFMPVISAIQKVEIRRTAI
jgi:hypothetical protein